MVKIKKHLNFRKNFISLLGVIFMTPLTISAQEVTVQVTNIDVNKTGNILVMLYSDKGFPKDHQQALAIKELPANKTNLTVNFSAVPEKFAIKILHDEDETGSVTKNWTGIIPAEGLGFSNGAKLFLGPPSFKKAQLKRSTITQPISIGIIYP